MLNKMKKINESGRSMVEMLGVLAIIGVLSVMGIAGYTAAMKSYKENEIVASTSMCYMMGMAQNGGTGKVAMTYTNPPTGASSINFGADNKVTITFSDTNLCAGVKAKFGDNAGDCSGNTLVVTLGDEEDDDITSSPWYKADCSGNNAPCVGNGYHCLNIYSCFCANGSSNPPNCNTNSVCDAGVYDSCYTTTYGCSSNYCSCQDSSETYPNCTKEAKCVKKGTCSCIPGSGCVCFDTTKTPPDCE